MTYTYTTDFDNDIILAPCLAALCAEIAVRYPNAVNLGEIGNAAHQTEGYGSDHNPFIVHNGKRYVRAIDVGGDEDIQSELFTFIMQHYVAQDPRVYPYGYVHKDNRITKWFGNGDTKYQPNFDTQYDAGDVGHLHISVTQLDGNNPSPRAWVSALDSHAPWGLVQEDDDMPEPRDLWDYAIKSPKGAATAASRLVDTETSIHEAQTDIADIKSLLLKVAKKVGVDS